MALVGRNNRAENGSTPAQYYLGGIAREAGMSYLEGQFELPAIGGDAWTRRLSSSGLPLALLMEESLRLPPPPHWGINE